MKLERMIYNLDNVGTMMMYFPGKLLVMVNGRCKLSDAETLFLHSIQNPVGICGFFATLAAGLQYCNQVRISAGGRLG